MGEKKTGCDAFAELNAKFPDATRCGTQKSGYWLQAGRLWVLSRPPCLREKLLSDLQRRHGANHSPSPFRGRDSDGAIGHRGAAAVLREAPKFSVLTVDHGLRVEARNEAHMVAAYVRGFRRCRIIFCKPMKSWGHQTFNSKRATCGYRLMAGFCRDENVALW